MQNVAGKFLRKQPVKASAKNKVSEQANASVQKKAVESGKLAGPAKAAGASKAAGGGKTAGGNKVPGVRRMADTKRIFEMPDAVEGIQRKGSEQKKDGKLRIIPLGGMQEIGKNMTVIEYKDDIIVVDAGLSFPEDEMLGIDIVIPDISYLVKNQEKIRGIVITHGHEDHIGAIPYILKKINVPIYGSKLTMGLIESKFKEHQISNAQLNITSAGKSIRLGSFRVDYIRVTHSIPDSCALAIHTPVGVVFHSGDFKIDHTPIDNEFMDFAKLSEVGEKGCLLMLCESTNVERPGYTLSEKAVGRTLDEIFADEKGKRLLVATFSSNIHRVQQIINSAFKCDRKVAVSGRSMINTINVARNLGYLYVPQETMIDINEMDRYRDGELVIITTGSQGEPLSALSRMAAKEHKKIEIRDNDVVILSAHPIPGNEKAVSRIINLLFEIGAKVIYEPLSEIHVSGHACREELKFMHRLIRPKFFAPVHGEYRHLRQHASVAVELGMRPENIFLMKNGSVLELDAGSCQLGGSVPSGNILVDGLGVGDVGNIVLRDRKHLAEDGLMVVVVTISREDSKLVSGPDVISRGFVYVRESEGLMDEARDIVKDTLRRCENNGITEWSYLKNSIKEDLKRFLYEKTKRNPMILPIIMEA